MVLHGWVTAFVLVYCIFALHFSVIGIVLWLCSSVKLTDFSHKWLFQGLKHGEGEANDPSLSFNIYLWIKSRFCLKGHSYSNSNIIKFESSQTREPWSPRTGYASEYNIGSPPPMHVRAFWPKNVWSDEILACFTFWGMKNHQKSCSIGFLNPVHYEKCIFRALQSYIYIFFLSQL